ncbi:MAG: ABC transporter ATP-binding protein [Acidobacteria bacterium]|nr:ABC transporter ATP-binding protein [Acidobacteriota bacterium]
MGGGGGGMFGGGANSHQANAAAGLPFAGIPQELQDGVERLLATEPEHPASTATFSHTMPDRRPLNLRRLMARHKSLLSATAVLVAIEAITLQLGPELTRRGIDRGIFHKDWGEIRVVGILFFFAVIATGLAGAGRIRSTGKIAANMMYDLRLQVFAQLQRLSLDYYTDEKAGVIMTRMSSDIENLQQLLQDGLVQFAVQGLTMTFVTVMLFHYNARLAAITIFAVVPVLTVLSLWFRAASDRGFERVRDGIAGVLSDLAESLAGVRVVTGFNRQVRNIVSHRNVTGVYRDANDYTAKLTAVYGPSSEIIGVLGQALVLLVGGNMVRKGSLTVGELTAFILYLNSFFQPIQQLVQLYNVYQQGQSSMAKLRQLLATTPSVPEDSDAIDLPPISGEIDLEGVMFGYDPAVPVLRDVDLHIAAGETICFVGPTGAGKSTVAKLITRFYDPTAGRVLIDGHDIRHVTIESLRRQLGVVPQEPFLFAGSIRDNLMFANPDSTEEDLVEAVEQVGLTELVERLPDGLDTPVHERGVSLSSGERQLLALGRAFLARPRVLVLDEATSNLDLQSETKVEKALDVLLEGRTAVLVAHRLSTAMRADRIAVVDHGRIVEMGSHAELVALGGRYAEMYASWSSHVTGDEGVAAAH